MKRMLIVVLAVLALVIGMAVPAMAATTADVSITATPSYVAIAMNANSTSYDFGTVRTGLLSNTTTNRLYVVNSSSASTDITIGTNSTIWCANGLSWAHSETAASGNSTAGLKSSHGTGNFTTVVRNATPLMLYNTCTSGTTSWAFELQLVTPNEYADGVQKSITVRLTASATP